VCVAFTQNQQGVLRWVSGSPRVVVHDVEKEAAIKGRLSAGM